MSNKRKLKTTADTPVVDDDFDPAQLVSVAYVHSNQVCYSWHHSMVQLLGWDFANHGRIIGGGYVAIRCGTDGLIDSRNKAVTEFLANRRADWLFWIDTDMGFAADTIDRLFDAADPVERPIVGALAFTQREEDQDGIGGWRCRAVPTLFDWRQVDIVNYQWVDGEKRREKTGEQQGFAVRWDYPANAVTQVAGTGSACVLIHRSVFEKIQETLGPVWYNRQFNPSTGQLISEDLSFCMRAGAVNLPVYVHTGVRTSHQKTLWLSEEDYWRQRAVDPPPPSIEDQLMAQANQEPAHE